MKAIQVSRFGAPGVLETVDVPTPSPGPAEVLVRVQAIGVNFFEVLMRQNRYAVTPELPMIPGVEVAGVVEAVGGDVTSPEVGARVAVPMFAANRPAGGYAEYVAIDAEWTVPVPTGLSFQDAVALMIPGLTAHHLVRRAPPAGKTVMVNAAAGGVGSLLIQLAKTAGAGHVIAVASSPDKLALAQSLGADSVINYSESGWVDRLLQASGGTGVDIVYDLVGGAATKAALGALAPRGELAFAALGRFDLGAEELEAMLARNQSLKGFALLPLLAQENPRDDLANLFELSASGELKVVHGGRYPLAQAAEAHQVVESRQSVGKVVLVP